MREIAVRVSHVKKTYRRYKSNWQKIQNLLFGMDRGDKNRVLRDVSFEIYKGEKVGIIAKPLSGRSTLMRMIAGVITPDSGKVEINGRLTPILDYKLGFEMTMDAEANYEIRCRILGWTDKMIKENKEKVFKRAALGSDLKEPLKKCKRGAANRLGFAISTQLIPEILLFDETFSMGGKKNTVKSVRRLKRITKGEDSTLIMIVNDLERCARLCERGLVFDKGRIVFDGTYEEAAAYYTENIMPLPKKAEEARGESLLTEASGDSSSDESDPAGTPAEPAYEEDVTYDEAGDYEGRAGRSCDPDEDDESVREFDHETDEDFDPDDEDESVREFDRETGEDSKEGHRQDYRQDYRDPYSRESDGYQD